MSHATQNQKNHIKQLLEELDAGLADLISKPLETLAYQEADDIITMLKNKEEYLCRAWLP